MTLQELKHYQGEFEIVWEWFSSDKNTFKYFCGILEREPNSKYVSERVAWGCICWLYRRGDVLIIKEPGVGIPLVLLEMVRKEVAYENIKAERN